MIFRMSQVQASPSPPPPYRVTQSQIAKAAGVSRVTVTYALRDNPKLAAATRERIQKLAREMGYAPDPMLASLAYYRTRRRPAGFHGILAWLAQEHPEKGADWWRESPHYNDYFLGAEQRAKYHGYKLETFHFNASGMPLRRIESILCSRGISGLLLCPLAFPGVDLEFAWDRFSVVTFGYTLHRPRLHTVATAHFQNTQHAMERLRARGFRRIGLTINRTTDTRANAAVSSAFLGGQNIGFNEDGVLIPPHFYNGPFHPYPCADYVRELAGYIRAQRLDAILTGDSQSVDLLREACAASPRKPLVGGVSFSRICPGIAGIADDSFRIGTTAVDLVVAMIQRSERGIPEVAVRSHVEGIWHDGVAVK
ncbi:MAG: LacI family transcriptional regulator [Opitutaceae bacterium]|jgi:LacI family transcriptional regulator/LacI family repressor for deo operon, udp, cdd, tsx, nupC, and nupG|nr:LacI family transcriptional regulator [Opitutaceae bacterium]